MAQGKKPAKVQSAWQALRSAFEEAGLVNDEFAKIMEEVEAARKRDFGRPLPWPPEDDHLYPELKSPKAGGEPASKG